MKIKLILFPALAVGLTAPLIAAADTNPGNAQAPQSTSATMSSTLPSGKYTATLTPAPDSTTASAIKNQLNKIYEIKSIAVDPKDSTVRFTVKGNMQVASARIQNAVKTAAPDTNVSQPIMEPGSSPSATSGASGSTAGSPATPGSTNRGAY